MFTYDVYIVQCADGAYYTGVTNDVERRIGEHNAGMDHKAYTFRRRPVRLVYVADFWDVHQAITWEKIVKRWSRVKKEALIRGEYERLPFLSRGTCRRRVDAIVVMVRRTHHDNFARSS